MVIMLLRDSLAARQKRFARLVYTVLVLWAPFALGGFVILDWDFSPEPDTLGYVVHMADGPSVYSTPVGMTNRFKWTDLPYDATFIFGVNRLTETGEVSYTQLRAFTVPRPTPPTNVVTVIETIKRYQDGQWALWTNQTVFHATNPPGNQFFRSSLAIAQTNLTGGRCNITLAWDPSPDTNVTGYNLYWGLASRTYSEVRNAGTNCQTTITNLLRDTPYYFAATAYDGWGLESDYSDECAYTAPTTVWRLVSTLQYLDLAQGTFQPFSPPKVLATYNWLPALSNFSSVLKITQTNHSPRTVTSLHLPL